MIRAGSVAVSRNDNPAMLDFRKSLVNSALHKVLKRFHYPLDVMLTRVRWYVPYPLSLRRPDLCAQVRLAKGAWGCAISQ